MSPLPGEWRLLKPFPLCVSDSPACGAAFAVAVKSARGTQGRVLGSLFYGAGCPASGAIGKSVAAHDGEELAPEQGEAALFVRPAHQQAGGAPVAEGVERAGKAEIFSQGGTLTGPPAA